jgi:hypothetical protein
MKRTTNKLLTTFLLLASVLMLLQLTSCNNDDEMPEDLPGETGNETSFPLFLTATGLPGGTVTFVELDNNSTRVEIQLSGLSAGATHPAHIHFNSGAEGGGIAVSLESVPGSSGQSETIVSMLDDGTMITYNEFINFDGHVNVHLSASDLSTLIAQGDIGVNAFTNNVEDYELVALGGSGISGDVTFVERVSGEILVILSLENTPAGGDHPAHIHNGSVASGGGIAISLNNVNGDTGFSLTDISEFDDGTPVSFSELVDFEGHVKVHLSPTELSTVVAAGDIGNNELTGDMKEYVLSEVAVEGISGIVTFKERRSGKTLVEIALENTPQDGSHPAHIHANSFAEGGSVVVPLNNVNGDTGMSLTDVSQDNSQNPLTYDDLLNYDGHVMVHLSGDQISTIVARGDIGQNELTGNAEQYPLSSVAVAGIEGTVTFSERANSETLVTVMLANTPQDGVHPAHIHANTVAEGGGVVVPLSSVNGNTGMSYSNVAADNQGNALTYTDLIGYDGHVMVHLSADAMSTIVARGDIGQNALTDNSASYELAAVDGSGVSGSIALYERNNGYTLAVIALTGTPAGGDHPAHIHENDVATGGGIIIPLNNVNGDTGMSMTHIEADNNQQEIKYSDLITYNGHVKVHLSPTQLATVVAAGNIGSNADTGARVSFANDILPLINANCQISGCHGDSGGIPSWSSYDNIFARASAIKTRTGNGTMPPGGGLTTEQIQMIADWVDDGAPNN